MYPRLSNDTLHAEKNIQKQSVLETKQERINGSDTKCSEYICLDFN
jgi:hypothetical protein